jgi:exosortase/archaeosortase family protein
LSIATESIPLKQSLLGARARLLERWDALGDVTQTRIKVFSLIGIVVAAFHYSLSSLLQTLGYDTPLAYVGLVPIIALGLAWIHRIPRVVEPPIHDRQLDYILGLPLVAGSLIAAFVLPSRLGVMYWFNRVDLLLLPAFAAGATILIFGTRVAWRQKLAILYLFLAWPWPYTHILLGTLNGFTSVTLAGLTTALKVVPVATAVPGNSGLFQVMHHGQAFPVSVITACSGVDGMVGFFLVGAAFAGTVSGGRVRKALWLALGLVLLWFTNLARLVFIFWMGKVGGEHLAINTLHPIAGLAVFCIGIVLMMLLLRPFGLRLADSRATAAIRLGAKAKASMVPAAGTAGARMGTNRVFLATGIVALAGIILAGNNSSLRSYDLVASAAGEPKLGSFLAQPAAPTGWRASWVQEYTANKPLFGQSSRWFRYQYTPAGGPSDLHSSFPVTADVINAGGLSGFGQYGVQACYSFHGYTLRDVAQVNLGGGITGDTLSFSGAKSDQDWSIVYWIWPVATAEGTRYERVILYLQNTVGGSVSETGQVATVTGLKKALTSANPQQRRLIANRVFLVAFAREIVAHQSKQTDRAIDIAKIVPGGSGYTGASPTRPRLTIWQRLHLRPPTMQTGPVRKGAASARARSS